MPAVNGRRVHVLFAFLITLVALVVNQSAVHWRDDTADSHLFAYYGWCVAHGAVPYVDIWDNKPPGIFWLNAIGTTLCGSGTCADVAVGAVGLAVALLAFAGIVRTTYHRTITALGVAFGAMLLTQVYFHCGANRTETWVVACEALAVLAYLRWHRTGGIWWILCAGLAAGAAPCFKQSGIAAGLAITVHLLATQMMSVVRRGRSVWLAWIAGGLAVPLFSLIVLAAQGAIGDAYFAIVQFNRAYFDAGQSSWTRVADAAREYWPKLQSLGGVLVLVGFALILLLIAGVRRKPHSRPGPLLFLLWGALSFYAALISPGRLAYHLMPVLTPIALLALYPLHYVVARHGLVRTLTARPAILVAVLVFASLWTVPLIGQATELRRCWSRKSAWYACDPSISADAQGLAVCIRETVSPDGRVYIWGWNPAEYRMCERLPASRYATLEKLGTLGEHAAFLLDRVHDDLRTTPAEIIVLDPNTAQRWLEHPSADFEQWISEHYTLRVKGIYGLLVRADAATSTGG